ncbi:MAG: phospholipase D-like domain-containing protein [bacterium]|nr:phospholipase D-like domain-containing protein [bacterium]
MRGRSGRTAICRAAACCLAAAAMAAPAPAAAKIEVYFNRTERLERHLKGAFSHAVARAQEGRPGTIDIMIFSFTTAPLADSILRIARDYPGVRIRLIANLSQLFREPSSVVPDMEGIAAGTRESYRQVAERRKAFIKDPEQRQQGVDAELRYLLSEFRLRPLPNIEIRYKWFPAFSWNDEIEEPDYDHFHQKAALLHHKAAIINNEILVNGSYNWSVSAETKNFENLMIVSGPEDRRIVDDFIAEFEAIWNNPEIAKTSAECRALRDELSEKIIAEREKARRRSAAAR